MAEYNDLLPSNDDAAVILLEELTGKIGVSLDLYLQDDSFPDPVKTLFQRWSLLRKKVTE